MTALDARRLAQLAAYRHGGRAYGTVPAATVHDNAPTRLIHPRITGQHAAIDIPDPDDDEAPPVPRWRHAAHRPSPWAAAVVLAVAVLVALLAVAVTW